jgi:hypothetical protein
VTEFEAQPRCASIHTSIRGCRCTIGKGVEPGKVGPFWGRSLGNTVSKPKALRTAGSTAAAAPLVMFPAPYTLYQPPQPHHQVHSSPSRTETATARTESVSRARNTAARATIDSIEEEGATSDTGSVSGKRFRGEASSSSKESHPPPVALQHPRYSRRVQSKSEPSASSGTRSPTEC